MKPPQIPHAFQSLRALRVFNVVAVGLSLSCAATGLLGAAMASSEVSRATFVALGAPTLLCGLAWAAFLRVKGTIGKTSIRWSFLASVPLASLNSGLAYLLLSLFHGFTVCYLPLRAQLFELFWRGATGEVVAWLPIMLLTLVGFGIPIWRSHALAARGLSGEERGERVVGLISMFVAVIGLWSAARVGPASAAMHPSMEAAGAILELAMGVIGLASGFAAVLFSTLRARRRRAFVEAAAKGDIEGFRVSDTAEGRVLVRITAMGQGYRVANFEEPVMRIEESFEELVSSQV